jgi:hypoxanthine phosphoribosyltransferase
MIKSPGKVLISSSQIQKRVKELGKEITKFYNGKPFIVVGLMNGSLFFLVDLLRQLPADTQVECWRVFSYSGSSTTGKLKGLKECRGNFKGRDVIIIDDILDTGITLDAVQKHVKKLGAKSVQICALLDKKKKKTKNIKARWVGFDIPNLFVIGYGLDLDHRYRSLPMIRVLDL